MKVIIGLAVVAVLAALGTNWLRDKGNDFLHDRIDTALPSKVEAHPWSPVQNGTTQRTVRLSFQSGSLTARGCDAPLGTYSVAVSHAFTFTRTPVPARPGCPSPRLVSRLAKATHVAVEDHGRSQRLVLTDDDDHVVARLRGRGD